jgi:hypothetical protein
MNKKLSENMNHEIIPPNISQYTEHVMELAGYAYFITNHFKTRNLEQIILYDCRLQVCVLLVKTILSVNLKWIIIFNRFLYHIILEVIV